jgi:crossover junction endodeoxyribonuclease RuvC
VRVLAVDPGLTRCGVGVVDGVPGRKLALVDVGVIRTPSTDPTPRRLVAVEDEMRQWFARHRPEAVAIERVFADTNVSTVMGTAQVTGIVMIIAERLGLPVTLHTPTEVKAAVSGSGRADKAQVTTMVTRLLGLDTPPKPADAADALALAICHVWRGGTQNRLEEARLEVLARTVNRGSGIPRRVPPGAVPPVQRLRAASTQTSRAARPASPDRTPPPHSGAQPR